MAKDNHKPSPEAKALSLFLMAHKTTDPAYKEKAKRIKKRWTLVLDNKLNKDDYLNEVHSMLATLGGYDKVVAQTVNFYIEKTGKWELEGDDKYCRDAKAIADKILNV